ncbi:hypothetical protein ACIQ2D_04040 [Lysinibacillus sp. NPDC097287]|uniref:hypothetical protein n=1 Tax=Lysinibacillus sp. NPDC097287 TaxID=3364144 RepID=UPI00381735D0
MAEANQYMKDFKAKLSSIPNPKDYHLIINAKELKTVSADVQAVLAETISLYLSTPFKTVMFDSAISKSQNMRAGNKELADKFLFHDTLEAVLRGCR